MSEYEVALEIAGPAAMFARPDTGATPVSYPVPTASAAKGIFDSVLRRPHIYIEPKMVEICRPVRLERYATNYRGPLRKGDDFRQKNSYQLIATILVDVCYRIYGRVKMKRMSVRAGTTEMRKRRGQDWRPRFRELFNERLEHGLTFYTTCLGWKEFVPTYVGPFRKEDECGQRIERYPTGEIHIPAMLISMWDHQEYKPSFAERWIIDGVMSYEQVRPPKEVLCVE